MQAGKQNLIINKKASFKFDFYVLDAYNSKLPPDDAGQTPVNLTGCTFVAKARAKITDTAVLVTFTCSSPTPLKGHVRMSLTAAQTASLAFTTGVWDILITFPDASVVKYLEGNVVLDQSVS